MEIKILEHLPATGPMYKSISPEGNIQFSEGFVVQISPSNDYTWIGNFQKGNGQLSSIKLFSNTNLLLISAAGLLYSIDPIKMQLLDVFSKSANACLEIEGRLIVYADWSDLLCFSEIGLLWKIENIGIDGVLLDKYNNGVLFGNSYDPSNEIWNPFKIDYNTGTIIKK